MSCVEEKKSGTSSLWPQPRHGNGFYSHVEPIKGEGHIPLHCDDQSMKIACQISDDFIDNDLPLRGVCVTAQVFFENDNNPAAYVEFDVLTIKDGSKMPDEMFLDACDSINNTLHSLASSLVASSVYDMETVLSHGALIHLSRLEVRNDHTGRGIGEWLTNRVLGFIEEKQDCAILAIKPFPLQFERCQPDIHSHELEEFNRKFSLAEERLAMYYRTKFFASPSYPGSEYLISALGGFGLEIDEFGWSLN